MNNYFVLSFLINVIFLQDMCKKKAIIKGTIKKDNYLVIKRKKKTTVHNFPLNLYFFYYL